MLYRGQAIIAEGKTTRRRTAAAIPPTPAAQRERRSMLSDKSITIRFFVTADVCQMRTEVISNASDTVWGFILA